MKDVFLEGKKVYLGSLSGKVNLQTYASWVNDQEVTLYMETGYFLATPQSLRRYIQSFQKDPNGMLLGIFVKKTGRHIGNISLHKIDWKNRHGEVGIIIGDKKSYGKGFGSEAIHLLVDHAFNRVNLRKLYTGMIEGNLASLRVFEKAGFRLEGTLRQHFYLNGAYLDCLRLGVLREEYSKLRKEQKVC